MSALGTILMTAAATVGAVSAVRQLRQRAERRRDIKDRDRFDGPAVEMRADTETGVWKMPTER